MIKFIKNNMFFSIMFCTLCITSIIFILIGANPDSKHQNVIISSSEEQAESLKTQGVTDFIGQYDRKSDSIQFNWRYNLNDSDIESIYLLYNNEEIMNVTNYSSYQIFRDDYNVLPGNNDFTIIISTNDQKVYQATTTVVIDSVVSTSLNVKEIEDNSYEFIFTYEYSKENLLDVPNMLILDDIQYEKVHVKTTRDDLGNTIKAETLYRITFDANTKWDVLSVRLFFDDINDSIDFTYQKQEGSLND